MNRIGKIWSIFCGGTLIYLSIGSVIGVLIATTCTENEQCWPYESVFGVLDTACDSTIKTLFWNVTAGIPRLVLVPINLAVNFMRAGINNSMDFRYFIGSLHWFAFSLPTLFVLYSGARYWWRRSLVVGIVAFIPILYVMVRHV